VEIGDLSDFEVFEVTTIVTDNKRSPDFRTHPCTPPLSFMADLHPLSDLGDLTDLSHFEVFDLNTIVNDSKGSPDRKSET
jgi:hypothetical protein